MALYSEIVVSSPESMYLFHKPELQDPTQEKSSILSLSFPIAGHGHIFTHTCWWEKLSTCLQSGLGPPELCRLPPAAVRPKAAGTTVVLPAQLPPGRQSLPLFSKLCNNLKPLSCGCYFYFVALRSTLTVFIYVALLVNANQPRENFPTSIIWNWGKVVLAPGRLRGIALCNLLLSCWRTDLGQRQEGGPSSISATAAWGFGLCIF